MKRFGQIEIITAVIMIVTSLAGPAGAAITWSGDVDPSDPSTWDSSTFAFIGNTGNGTVGITGGSDVIDRSGHIGLQSGSTGEINVDGAGSTWTNNSNLYVGNYGDGTLNITDGGTVSNNRYSAIGYQPGSTGEINIDGAGSIWTNNDYLYVGCEGDGRVNVTGGGTVSNNSWGSIGDNNGSTGTVTVDGPGSTWTNSSQLVVGNYGDGTLNITDGGMVSNSWSYIGSVSSSTGTVTVNGANSTWTNTDYLVVGRYGNGTLNITNGGAVSNSGGSIGYNSGGTGEVTVDGTGSTLANKGLIVGHFGNGTLNITGGGLVSVAGTLYIDDNHRGDSFINMATGGMLALFGEGDETLAQFMGLIAGTDAIRYWDESIAGWADITGATRAKDYTLEYLTDGDLAGYTMLTVAEPVVPISLDIKPGSCPNPVNVKSKGVLPVAILGSEEFEVSTIDVASIFLNGVPAIRSSCEDVGGPVADRDECECTTEAGDGSGDLILKFYTQQIVETLGEVNAGDILTLPLTGVLNDETGIEGADCVVIVGRHKPINKADINKDGVVNTVDIAIVAENWLESSIVEE